MSEDHAREQKPERGFTPIGASLNSLFPQLMGGDFPTAQDAPAPPIETTKAAKKPTKATLAKAGAEIAARPEKAETAFLGRPLVQCTLPHRDPGDVPAWVRRNGNLALVLQPGFDAKTMTSVGIPFGEWPRLLLLWIMTEAVQKQTRHIKFKGTFNEFLRKTGGDLDTGRGKRGAVKRMKDQFRRLLHCRIYFQDAEGNQQHGEESLADARIVEKSRLMWDFKERDQDSLFENEIILTEKFYNAIIANPVPIDWRAVMALKQEIKQSSFAIDIYIWTTYRVFRLQENGIKEVRIPLPSLKEQFGAEYNRLDNFKAAFAEALNHVEQVFPGLDYSFEKGSLILRDGKGKRAVPTRQERPALPRQRVQQMARQISPRARAWFEKNHRGLDIETAISDFDFWVDKQQVEPRSVDAVFITFVREHWAK